MHPLGLWTTTRVLRCKGSFWSNGLSFYDTADEQELLKICQLADRIATRGQGLCDVAAQIVQTQYQPLPMLVLLRGISNAVSRLWAGDKSTYKPLCVLLQFAPALLPEGDFDRLSELDWQRLVTFLNWIHDPLFSHSGNFLVLLADTKSEMNRRIL